MNRFSVKIDSLPQKTKAKQGSYEDEWICNADLRRLKCLQFNHYFDVTSTNLVSGNLSPFEGETRKERRKQTESKK
jgi:hypothetical protein